MPDSSQYSDYEDNKHKEDCLDEWESHLTWFKSEIYPTFASYGFTLSEAYMAYNTRALVNFMDIAHGEE